MTAIRIVRLYVRVVIGVVLVGNLFYVRHDIATCKFAAREVSLNVYTSVKIAEIVLAREGGKVKVRGFQVGYKTVAVLVKFYVGRAYTRIYSAVNAYVGCISRCLSRYRYLPKIVYDGRYGILLPDV